MNSYSWDTSGSASEVEGSINMNFCDENGEPVIPYSSDTHIPITMENSQEPTRIDFTNATYDNLTGMLYAELEIPNANNAFLLKLARPISAVQDRISFSVSFYQRFSRDHS